MKKLIELVKRLVAWVVTKAKKFAGWVAVKWKKFVWIVTAPEFVYGFPFGMFILLSIILWSFLMFIIALIWLIPLIKGMRNEDQ